MAHGVPHTWWHRPTTQFAVSGVPLAEDRGTVNLVLKAACRNIGPWTKSLLSDLLCAVGTTTAEQAATDDFATHFLHTTLGPWLHARHGAWRRSSMGVGSVLAQMQEIPTALQAGTAILHLLHT
jgi:hypothetical protein